MSINEMQLINKTFLIQVKILKKFSTIRKKAFYIYNLYQTLLK